MQHDAYERALRGDGWTVRRLPPLDDHPDAVFVEDVAVALDEVAVLARPGAASRRGEVASAERALGAVRPLVRIEPPGTLDGGDVLRVGRRVWVGRSRRTNEEGARQLRAILAPFGYDVREVPVSECLHLKTAVTAATDDLLVLNPAWTSPDAYAPLRCLTVDPRVPFAANVLRGADTVFVPADAPATAERLRGAGVHTTALDLSELAKAEGGLTCCCILVA